MEHLDALYTAIFLILGFIVFLKLTRENISAKTKNLISDHKILDEKKQTLLMLIEEHKNIGEDIQKLRITYQENLDTYNGLVGKYNILAEKYNLLNNQNKLAVESSQKLSQHITELERQKQQLESECQSMKTDFEAECNAEKDRLESEINNRRNQLETEFQSLKTDFEAKMSEKIQEYTTEGEKRRKAMQDAWEKQIRTGNCPENITLREANRSAFFATVSASSQPGNYASMKFGSAVDALSFAESMREYFECPITVAQISDRGEYQVFIDGASPEKIKPHYNTRTGKFEFMNPVYDGTAENYRAITDEQETILRLAEGGKYTTGEEYERYVAERLAAAGYINIQLTSKSNDYGADLICERSGIKYSVQCKMYSNPVGVSAVQEVNSSLAHYRCDKGMVITTNIFTSQARKLAGENGITLMENFT